MNSKTKGNRFERTICKYFKEWTGYEFSRVPQSGGLRWKKADNISSDIICSDKVHSRRFPCNIECKFHKEIKFEEILLGNKNCKIFDFWEQVLNDSSRANRIPLLIMRYNNMPSSEAFLVISPELFRAIKNDKFKKPKMRIFDAKHTLVVMMLSDLKNLEYAKFYKACKALKKKN